MTVIDFAPIAPPRRPKTGDPLAHEELIDSRIDIHDSNQFEVKLDYSINPKARKNRYSIEVYFFVPRSLGINSYTYSKEQFYSDIQAYIRFKTPSVSLSSLADPKNELSPLQRIESTLGLALRDLRDSAPLDSISHELRMLGCLVRANIRDRVAALSAKMRALRGHVHERATVVEDLRAEIKGLLCELDDVIKCFRGMRSRFADPVLPLWIREVYLYVDEFISLVTETHLTLLVEDLDRQAKLKELLTAERQRVCDVLLFERKHRQGAGYLSVLKPNTTHDHYVYRRGLLKKFVMSVLFLEISKEKDGNRIGHIIGGLAAGVAMLVATVLGLVSQARWGLNTLPFVLALVGSYILKDRIKDWLKLYFSAKMTKALADYDVQIRDPETDVVLGNCREAFSFIDMKKVPQEVLNRRHQDRQSSIEAESKPEVVMKYEKAVRLNGHTIGEKYGRVSDINDIIRFNIADFLVRTDDPMRNVRHYDAERDVVESVKCPKVYHLNVIFVLRAQDTHNKPTMERVRVIIDKRGIRRLDEA